MSPELSKSAGRRNSDKWQGTRDKKNIAPQNPVTRHMSQVTFEKIVRLLSARKKTLALAESCTGGFITNGITNVPGASEIFPGGIVAYSNGAKEKFLGVQKKSLEKFGAVSEAVAREMAEGARKKFGADFAIAVTGIAGPTGGTKDKPVGTVFIALAGNFETVVERKFNSCEREAFKQLTAQQALEMLRGRLVSA
jgi:nicotinamide-nucleotide amidase